jgi:hypothetical protein
MPLQPRSLLAAAALLFLAAAPAGCISGKMVDFQIGATRRAAVAVGTIADYEVQRSAMQAGIVQFEGMHSLRPDNEDALFMLTQSWAGYAFAYPQEDYEDAVDRGDDDLAAYHKGRARNAYDRAVFYALELLSHRAEGFDRAKRNTATLEAWLRSFTTEDDATNLLWAGYAWLGRVNLLKDEPAMVAEAFIGVGMVERSVALDPTLEHWAGTTVLAAYHGMVPGEDDRSKALFEKVLAKTERKNLQVQLNYATGLACVKGDRALYESLINEVLAATDPDPEQRFTNMLAKRRARRALGKSRMTDCGFDMSSHAPPHVAPPPPVSASATPAPATVPPPKP